MCKMPRVGEKVYVLYGDELYEETVFAVGEKHFILESFRTTVELFWLQNFDDEGATWFFSIEDAKDGISSYATVKSAVDIAELSEVFVIKSFDGQGVVTITGD